MFRLPIRIYIEDTDAGGVVFYANYLKFFERARTEFVRSLGYALRAGLNTNLSFVVRDLSVKYRQPAKLDDIIVVTAEVKKLANASITFNQAAYRCEHHGKISENTLQEPLDKMTLLASAEVNVVSVQLDTLKPCRLPLDLKKAFDSLL